MDFKLSFDRMSGNLENGMMLNSSKPIIEDSYLLLIDTIIESRKQSQNLRFDLFFNFRMSVVIVTEYIPAYMNPSVCIMSSDLATGFNT